MLMTQEKGCTINNYFVLIKKIEIMEKNKICLASGSEGGESRTDKHPDSIVSYYRSWEANPSLGEAMNYVKNEVSPNGKFCAGSTGDTNKTVMPRDS